MTEKNKLISAIYAATLSPDNFNAFTDDLHDLIVGIVTRDAPKATAEAVARAHFDDTIRSLVDPELRTHIENAAEIQSRIGHLNDKVEMIDLILKAVPNPAYVFDQTENIVNMNALAADRNASLPRSLAALFPDEETLDQVRRAISEERAGQRFHSIPIRIQIEAGEHLHVLLKELEQVGTGKSRKQLFLLTVVDLGFDRSTKELFKTAFGLTEAEATVAVMFASGKQVNEIAQERGASLVTVRTQIRSLKSKTGVRDLPELVRLLFGFSTGVLVPTGVMSRNVAATDNLTPVQRSMTLRDGRRLEYVEQGAASGEPVLMIHNMPYGVELPRAAIAEAARRNLRIIAPYRPGYGYSDMIKKVAGKAFLDGVADDFAELMGTLGINQVIVVSHAIGSVYATRFAKKYPQKVSRLVMVSHAPIWRDDWLHRFPKRQRLVMLITKYFPRLLPLLIWSMLAYINKGNSEDFLRYSMRDSPADQATMDDPEILHLMASGSDQGLRQGPEGFCMDCALVQTDLTEDARGFSGGIHLIHGTDDTVFNPAYAQAFADVVPATTLEFVENAGTLLIYGHWLRVLDAVSEVPTTRLAPQAA